MSLSAPASPRARLPNRVTLDRVEIGNHGVQKLSRPVKAHGRLDILTGQAGKGFENLCNALAGAEVAQDQVDRDAGSLWR